MARGRKKANEEPVNTKIKLKSFAAEKHFDESLTEAPIEEHVILRLPPSLAKAIKGAIIKRDIPADLSLTWKDARHGKLSIGPKTLNTTLVDLPCISESLKTLDNKQFYKIADISQMIIAHEKKNIIVAGKDYSWPDGLSPVLQNVRNARFRKRMNKKIVEDVEEEIERLLLTDFDAEDVSYEVLERKENESDLDEDEMDEDDGEDEEGDDFDLAAAIDEALDKGEEEQEEDEDDSEEDDESGDESDQELEEDPDEKNEENELKIQANALRHEITALEAKLLEKEKLASNQVNAIMKERFKGIVEKLAKELELKKEQLESLMEEIADNEDL